MSTVNGVGSSSNTNSTASSNVGTLTQSQFYQIIVAQLENQDPDDAADTNQMVQSMMSLANYQATQTAGADTTTMKNYLTATTLVGQDVDVTVPATTDSAAQTVSGTVSSAGFSSSGASVTINGTAYSLDDVTSVNAPVASGNGTGN